MILIVYDARRDKAYWLYVQSYFQAKARFNVFAAKATLTVRIPTANVVNPEAIRRFARFRDRVFSQIGEVIHDEDA